MRRPYLVLAAAACVAAMSLLARSVGSGPGRAPSPRTPSVDSAPVLPRAADGVAQEEPETAPGPVVAGPPALVPVQLSPADRETLERHGRRFGPDGATRGSDEVTGSAARPPESEAARRRRLGQIEALQARELVGVLDAIAAGLVWLADHQRADGWFLDSGAALRCAELGHVPPCVASEERQAEWSMGGTALAVMAFAGFRDQDVRGRFEPALARGVACLRAKQFGNGGFPSGALRASASLSLIALGRMAAATGEEGLRDAVRRGLAHAVKEAAPDGGYRYWHEPFGDLRETAWIVLAAEEARDAGIGVPEAMSEGIPRFLASVWLGGHRFSREGGGKEWPALDPVGMLTGLLVWDDERRVSIVDDWRGWVAGPPPTRLYPLYHGVRVANRLEPRMPQPWREALLELAKAQGPTGAWRDIEPYPLSEIGYAGVGVVHTTAVAVLILEEALRVERLAEPPTPR